MRRFLCATLAGALAGALAAGGIATGAERPEARADGSLSVRLVRDITGSGTYQPALALGVPGAPITVTDAAGKTVSASTGADGTAAVNLAGLSGGKYRVQGSPPAGSVLQPAPAGQGLSPLTSFVDVSNSQNVSLTMGLWNPADYCQENPVLVTGCQRNGIKPGVDNAARSLVTAPFTARGTAPAPAKLASQGDTGTVYGIAYRKQDKRVFSGAFAKRATLYGPGGPGAVYVTDTVAKTTKVFTKVPGAGNAAHAMQTTADGAFADVVGKQALGDVDISEDGSTLYVVNLADKKLYLYDAAAATATDAKSSYVIPDPGCPADGDWRPGALGVRDGVVHVGGVCSGESTQKQSDMRVVVRPFNAAAGTFGAPLVNKTLDFQRGTALWQGTPTDRWLPWQAKFKQPTPTGGLVTNPEPLLTDIGVEARGDFVLAFRDRFGDQGGSQMPPADGSTGLYDTVSGGDLNRVCLQANGSYAWEGTSGCANNNTPANNGGGQLASVVEYYPGEHYTSPADGAPHNETAQGAVAMVYGAARMPATIMDPTALRTGGLGWFDRANGTMEGPNHPNGYLISDVTTEGWGKANGLADLEALCDQAPVQIGDRVWFDGDANGVQDPAEQAIPGVVVQLLACDGGGAPLATATTNASGLYYFGKDQGLKPETCYTLKFDYSKIDTSKLPGAPPVSALKWTTPNAGSDATINSKADATGTVKVTVGKAGSVDHTLDAGIVGQLNKLGDYVWVDANRNGIQDAGEAGVPGVTVVLQDKDGKPVGAPVTTGPDGKYVFGSLPDGSYRVCFDVKNLPAAYADYQVTKQNAAGHDGTDSAADPGTGCTQYSQLGAEKREDLTLDMGIVSPLNRLGDYVWVDTNRNGIQDAGEPAVPGVPVTLQDKDGKPVGAPVTTGPDGKYLFGDLPDGSYRVCFDVKKLPAGYADYQVTKQNAAGHNGTDSAADPATGCTVVTELKAGHREDLTLDMGIAAPVNRLGDYVWVDANRNGVQDAGEAAVPGVPVTLQDKDGKQVASTVTNPDGKYLFDNLADGSYRVCFDLKKLPAAYADYQVTKQNAAGHNGTDSAADPATGCTMVTELKAGNREDLTLDAGLVAPPNQIGDYVWFDKNNTGLQDPAAPAVPGVPVTLVDKSGKTVATATTDESGKYLFDNLPDGTYKVCFDLSKLAAPYTGYVATKPNAAGHNGKDSAADPATNCTGPVTVGVGHRSDLFADLGITPQVNRLGDYVWIDGKGTGLQDPGDQPMPGITVTLTDKDGKLLATTTTGPDGKYLFDGLAYGTYQVCFPVKDLPEEYRSYTLTKTGAAGLNGTDSAAEQASGCTRRVTLDASHHEDFTLDAGYLEPVEPPHVPKPTGLSNTGVAVGGLVTLALLLLVSGGVLVLVTRRRRAAE